MAKTRAPLLSLEASGSLAKVLIMSRGRRQPYTKYAQKPKDPKTAKQLGRRIWFKGLANAWTQLLQWKKDAWIDCPTETDESNYNRYMRYNLALIDQEIAPTLKYPWLGTAPPSDVLSPTLTGGPRHVINAWTITAAIEAWFLLIYRDDSPGFTPTNLNIVRAVARTSAGTATYIDAPLDAGTYYYRAKTTSERGNDYTWAWSPSVVVPSS